jgi:dTDP-4-dehydrorhamnose reductase
MRVVVTGADGRLGGALVGELKMRGIETLGWTLPAFDLDRLESFSTATEAVRPGLVLHAAAWTDVEGCAREPGLAMRRNGDATGRLAAAAQASGAGFLYVSTNEVFDGRRTDARGYGEEDTAEPGNAYGASKLAGEKAASAAYAPQPGTGPSCWIVRTGWLYGPPSPDFGIKVLGAALRARAEYRVLRLVDDEMGSPTRARDLAVAILELVGMGRPGEAPARAADAGVYHLVNEGVTSRAGWAEALLAALGVVVAVERVPLATWVRASTPPRWGVLDAARASGVGVRMRPWHAALADELPRYREWIQATEARS